MPILSARVLSSSTRALSVQVGMAKRKLHNDPAAAEELLGRAGDELSLALEELRELARGIHPAILTDRGLPAALEALANRATVPVEIERGAANLPPPVEVVPLVWGSTWMAVSDGFTAGSGGLGLGASTGGLGLGASTGGGGGSSFFGSNFGGGFSSGAG